MGAVVRDDRLAVTGRPGRRIGPGIDPVAPYTDMRDACPWQSMRFREHHNAGPDAVITVPANRPQLTDAEAATHTPAACLGDRHPHRSL